MSSAGSQAAAFYRDVAKSRTAWTVRDAGGFPAPMTSSGHRAQPFWSTRSRVERIIAQVPAYSAFEPVEIPLQEFLDRWLSELRRDEMLVGVNWSGPTASGYDAEPDWVQHSLEVELEKLGGPAATPLERIPSPKGGVMYRLVQALRKRPSA